MNYNALFVICYVVCNNNAWKKLDDLFAEICYYKAVKLDRMEVFV
jgi:hypothetical protein